MLRKRVAVKLEGLTVVMKQLPLPAADTETLLPLQRPVLLEGKINSGIPGQQGSLTHTQSVNGRSDVRKMEHGHSQRHTACTPTPETHVSLSGLCLAPLTLCG